MNKNRLSYMKQLISFKTKMKFEPNKKIKDIGVFLSAFLFFFTVLYFRKDHINIFNLSYNQILTAMEWLNGKFFWPGPEAPYQGHYMPGPLMYFLLMPPLLLSKTPYAGIMVWMIVWSSLTYSLTFSFIRAICKNAISPFFFLLLLFTNRFFFHTEHDPHYLNYSFSLIFHLLTFIFIYNWREKKEDINLCWLGITIGLGVQLSYSLLLYLPVIFTLFITDERILSLLFNSADSSLKHKAFQWRYLSAFILFLLLPQIPYLTALTNSEVYLPKPNPYHIVWLMQDFFSEPLQRLKALLYFMDLSWIKTIGCLFICMGLYIYKSNKKEKISIDESLMTLFLVFVSLFLTGFMFPGSLFFIGLPALILFIKWHDSLWPKKESLKYICFAIYILLLNLAVFKDEIMRFNSILFLFVNLIMILGMACFLVSSYKKQKTALTIIKALIIIGAVFPAFYQTDHQKSKTQQLKEVMRQIYKQTGWTEETAMSRIFAVNWTPKRSFSFSYLLAVEEEKPKTKKNGDSLKVCYDCVEKKKNQGWFIIDKEIIKEKQPHQKIEDYILSKTLTLPKEVKTELLNGALKIQKAQTINRYSLLQYDIAKNSMFPKGFHNTSTANPTIDSYKEPVWFQECPFSGLFEEEDNTFYLCYLFEDYLEKIGANISFSKRGAQNFVAVDIEGPPLAVISSKRVIPHHFIKNLSLELICGKKETINLLSQIGLNNNIILSPNPKQNSDFHSSLFAPLAVKKPIHCPLEKITKISLHFEHQRRWDKIIAQSFSLDLD